MANPQPPLSTEDYTSDASAPVMSDKEQQLNTLSATMKDINNSNLTRLAMEESHPSSWNSSADNIAKTWGKTMFLMGVFVATFIFLTLHIMGYNNTFMQMYAGVLFLLVGAFAGAYTLRWVSRSTTRAAAEEMFESYKSIKARKGMEREVKSYY